MRHYSAFSRRRREARFEPIVNASLCQIRAGEPRLRYCGISRGYAPSAISQKTRTSLGETGEDTQPRPRIDRANTLARRDSPGLDQKGLQSIRQTAWQFRHPVLAILPMADGDYPPLEIHVLDPHRTHSVSRVPVPRRMRAMSTRVPCARRGGCFPAEPARSASARACMAAPGSPATADRSLKLPCRGTGGQIDDDGLRFSLYGAFLSRLLIIRTYLAGLVPRGPVLYGEFAV